MSLATNRLAETSALLGFVAALLAPGYSGPLLSVALIGLWLALWARRRERWLVGALLVASTALLLLGHANLRQALDPERKKSVIQGQFHDVWEELDQAGSVAAVALQGWRDSPDPLEPFARLERFARQAPDQQLTYLLVGSDEVPIAWSGPGLLHDLEGEMLPAEGRSFRLGFQSASLFSVSAVPEAMGERVLVGRSLFTNELPRRDRFLGPIRWTAFRPGDVVPPDLLELSLGSGPKVAVEDWTDRAMEIDAWESRARRWGAVLLAIGLLTVVALRTRGGRGGLQRAMLIAGAATAAGLAARLDPSTLAALVGAAFLAPLVWWNPSLLGRWTPPGWLRALLGVGGLLAIALAAQPVRPKLDLGSDLLPGHEATAWRLAMLGLTIAWLALRRATDRSRGGATGWLGAGFVLLLTAGALHDQSRFWLTVVLLAAGAAAGALWVDRQPEGRLPGAAAVMLLLGALISAATWETASRETLKAHLSSVVLPGLARPEAAEREQLQRELDRHFSELDLDTLALTNPAGLEPQDLGIAVWRESPLAVPGGLSAVTVQPFDGPTASFSLGLPLTNDGHVDWTPTRWRKVEEPSPADFVLSDTTAFLNSGRPWAEVTYTLLMRPGFELSRQPIRSLAARLLRGGPGPFRPAPQLIAPAVYGLYSPAGEAMEPAWPGVDLPLERILAKPGLEVSRPGERAVGFAARGPDGVQVLLLSILGPLEGLERVAMHAVAGIVVLGGLLLLGWLCALPSLPSGVALSKLLRSYSKRMLLVSTLLLLVPVLLLNTFALRVLTDQLQEEQRAAGEAALDSAQRVLGEYILALEPGFGFETVLDNELLSWLSRVIHHEVNLYWGSSIYVSSKFELFSAGLLPKRIPGEVYASLAIDQARRAARVNSTDNIEYLELYAPLTIPGQAQSASGLFLSVPMLAQQVETAAEVASLRRKILLATAALVFLLLGVGVRLARGFTSPLMEIVDGTQRIAAGARSLDVRPADVELGTLVDAIDQMAQKIADGRQRLVLEKALVERVVDNVNSGVISVDQNRRVLLINQVARDLLGAEIGEPLPEALARREHLEPLAQFLDRTDRRPISETVELPDAEGDGTEWSLAWVPLPGEGEPTALLVVEDVTEVLRGQRLQAWAEMARIIAHEIKNPLTPIRLSAEHMRKVRRDRPDEFDRVFERCTANILEQVDELRQISTEFSAYSRLPKIEPIEGDLGEAVAKIVDGYRASSPESLELEVTPGVSSAGLRFDAKLIGRALRNLIENALRATTTGAPVEVRVGTENGRASIRVLDRGPGVDAEDLARIFDPYFSTHDTGTGLGLPIARRIAEEHGGGIHAKNRPQGGLEVELWIPAE